MGKLYYDESSVSEFKNTVYGCNSDILDALKKISIEVDTIEEVLSTPKSVKTTNEFNEYFKDKVSYLNTNTEYFDKLFDGVMEVYQNSYQYLRSSVGDNND